MLTFWGSPWLWTNKQNVGGQSRHKNNPESTVMAQVRQESSQVPEQSEVVSPSVISSPNYL